MTGAKDYGEKGNKMSNLWKKAYKEGEDSASSLSKNRQRSKERKGSRMCILPQGYSQAFQEHGTLQRIQPSNEIERGIGIQKDSGNDSVC